MGNFVMLCEYTFALFLELSEKICPALKINMDYSVVNIKHIRSHDTFTIENVWHQCILIVQNFLHTPKLY